jgi:hypothetical protein
MRLMVMRSFGLLMFAVLVLGMPASCYAGSAHDAAVYYPLEPGDSWTYHFGGENGTVHYDVTGYSDEDKGYIIRRCAKMIDVSLTTDMIIGTSGGMVVLKGGTDLGAGKFRRFYNHGEVILNSPVKTGNVWEYDKDNTDNNWACRVRCRVVRITDMDVKAGHFKNVCMLERVASYLDKDGTEKYREVHNEYYAPHVGKIKEELVEDANDAIRAGHAVPLDPPAVLLELVSYDIK